MRIRLYLSIALGLLAATGLAARRARADAFTYSQQTRVVRAGILTSSALNIGNYGPENPDPHVFYVLEQRTDLKPAGMTFVNPLAPPVITADIYARWRNRVRGSVTNDAAFDPSSPVSQAFQVGARVTKNMGAYWEVNLDNMSADDLRQFDLLFIHSHKPNVSFSADQREKLRKYVEAGGTLWVDNCGGLSFDKNSPFLLDVNMNNGGNPSAAAVIAAPDHPLMSYPYILTPNDLSTLGDKGINDYYLYQPADPNDPAPGQNAVNPPGQQTLVPIVWNTRGQGTVGFFTPNPNWRPYILAGALGAGRLVFSAQDSGCAINDYVGGSNAGYGGNSGAVSGEVLIGAHPADLKFVYNMATWSAANMTSNTDVRRSGGTGEAIGARLADKWVATGAFQGNVGGAAVYKHCIFCVDHFNALVNPATGLPYGTDTTKLFLHCYDSNPGEDLDGDQNPDDGAPDYIAGVGYDQVWQLDLTSVAGTATSASTPTIVEFYDPSQNGTTSGLANLTDRTLVVVVLSDGSVVAVRAYPRLAAPNFPLASYSNVDWGVKLPGATDFGTDVPPAAAWSEGVLFVSARRGDNGFVMALDPHNGASAFNLTDAVDTGKGAIPDPNGSQQIPPVISSPTVGYVRDNASGASDKMVYVQTAPGTNISASVKAFWFGTKSEPLRRIDPTTYESRTVIPWYNNLDTTRSNPNNLLRPRVFWKTNDTPPQTRELIYAGQWDGSSALTVDQFATIAPAAGQPQRIKIGPLPDDGRAYFADYSLDWAPVQPAWAKVNTRSTLFAPEISPGTSTIGGAPALSPEDILYYGVETNTGSENPGRGVLFAVNEQLQRGGVGTAAFTTLKWAYTMHDGVAFPVNGQTVYIPPRLRQIDPQLPDYGQPITNVQYKFSPAYRNGVVYAVAWGSAGNDSVSLLLAFNANPEFKLRLNQAIPPGTALHIKQINPVLSRGLQTNGSLQTPQWVELSPQQYTVDNDSGLIRITAMAPPGSVGNFASASLPFVVQVGNGPEQLLFGTVTDPIGGGETRPSAPADVDNLLWYAVLPQVVTDNKLPVALGLISTSPSVQGNTVWLGSAGGCVVSLDADPGSTDAQAQARGAQVRLYDASGLNLHLRWARFAGAGQVSGPPIAMENVLAANTSAGIRTFEDNLTVIADNNRIIEVNSASEAVWVADGTRSYGVAGGELPQYLVDPNTGNVIPANQDRASGVPVVYRVPFSRPNVARRIGINDLLVVDTGNNRVVDIDRGANIKWEVNRLQDDFKHALRPGDPLTLNEPTDCAYWTEFNPALTVGSFSGPAWLVHYLIADTGNYRVVELVDLYDAAGRPITITVNGSQVQMLRQVNFVSSTYGSQGKRYRYRTAQRVTMRNSDLPPPWQYDPYNPNQNLPAAAIRQLTLAMVDNMRLVGNPDPARLQGVNNLGDLMESGGGSILLLNEKGTPLSIVSNLRVPDASAPGGFRAQPINSPTCFTKFDEVAGGALVFKYLLCDANGCYQLAAGIDPNTGQAVLNVEWMLSATDYFAMTGKRLAAASIRRLSSPPQDPNGNVTNPSLRQFLITNRFTGAQDLKNAFRINYFNDPNPNGGYTNVLNILGPSDFHGEVFILNPYSFNWTQANHGYATDYVVAGGILLRNPASNIAWRVPEEVIPLGTPGFIRGIIGSPARASSTSILEQPTFADRPF